MVELRASNGVIVHAADDAVEGLLAFGFERIEAPKKQPERKPTARKATRKTTSKE